MKNVLFIVSIFLITQLNAQLYFFTEGTDNNFYDQGIVNLSVLGNSTFEHTSPPCCPEFDDKVPCSTIAYRGATSLKFHYTSASDGNWEVSIFATNWKELDISNSSHLFFYVYSENGIEISNFPLIALKAIGTTNGQETNTNFYDISDYNSDIPAAEWTKLSVPLELFSGGDNPDVDFKKCKAVVFAQSEKSGTERTILIDNINAWIKPDSVEPIKNLSIAVYDSHTELAWDKPIAGLNARLYVSNDSGASFELLKEISENNYRHFFDRESEVQDIMYRIVTAFDDDESSPVDTTITSTEFTNDELMNMVQQYTWKYFWDYADPTSGMIYERSEFDEGGAVASGASGMGLMALIVGHERNYADQELIKDRILKMLNFLENCDRFHGAYSHWYDGATMKAIPFSTKDDGGDIVETSFVAQGFLALRNYFNGDNEKDQQIREKATQLWEEIEWDWYTKDGGSELYWHWSPNYGWEMNHPFGGFNETLITYFLAAASPTHPIPSSVYHSGWARNGNIVDPRTYYGQDIKLAPSFGGPMFWIHYSFMGLNPFEYDDNYANYGEEATSISKIHYEYAKANPFNHTNYSENNWGLTASYDPEVGYKEHRPYDDNGTIAPTAALGSFPYTPEESMQALKYFYRERGEELFGRYGFYDAFNDGLGVVIEKYLGIDQGPIVVMMENQRSGLLWNSFMVDEDVKTGIDRILNGTNVVFNESTHKIEAYPNPTTSNLNIKSSTEYTKAQIYSISGSLVKEIEMNGTTNSLELTDLENGVYMLKLLNAHGYDVLRFTINK